MRKWIEKILPGYSVLPLILAVSINMLVYFGTSQLRDYLTFHTITTALDEWIPFVAPFILFMYWHIFSGLRIICWLPGKEKSSVTGSFTEMWQQK